jgi:hypothetical protein
MGEQNGKWPTRDSPGSFIALYGALSKLLEPL